MSFSELSQKNCYSFNNTLRKNDLEKKQSWKIENFKDFIQRLKTVLTPGMQHKKMTLDEMDDIMFQFMGLFNMELYRIGSENSLADQSIETIMKLCLPNKLEESAMECLKKVAFEWNDERVPMAFGNMDDTAEGNLSYSELLPKTCRSFEQVMKRKSKRNKGSWGISHFKNFILRLNAFVIPKMQLQKMTLDEMDDFLSHVIDMFDKELVRLSKIGNRKTLTHRDLETAMKLCLPYKLEQSAKKYGRKAVSKYLMERHGKRVKFE